MKSLPVSMLFCWATFGFAAEPFPESKIDEVVAKAIEKKDVPGAVVVVVHDDKVVFKKAYGDRSVLPNREAMTLDTIFDLASLTKPIATATAIHMLAQKGQLKYHDPVSKYWPEFAANGKSGVTIEQCLVHTTGLTADNAIGDYAKGEDEALRNIAKLPLEAPPGTRFRYSDVGFIVLGELVKRISGQTLDRFTSENIFRPLKMPDTGYKPTLIERVAPTGQRDKKSIRGVVHDPRAFAMNGVAGHAGLFGTAEDLARFARMLMNGGELDGVRILRGDTVIQMTERLRLPNGGYRSLGWDVDTSFSGQRGDVFPAGDGFGHTGFTGTSIWVDPLSKTAVIILSNRVHPDDKGNAAEVRRKVGTLIGQKFALKSPRGGNVGVMTNVSTGLDVLKLDKFASLQGKTIGLVTNHTGIDRDGATTIDLLANAPNVKLVKLFSPEHGIRGEKDEKVGDGKDEKTGLPVLSLYGDRRKPTVEQLQGLDAIVYDIQDIGCRFYTYISTLKGVMEVAAQAKVPVIVLDRPNPIGGLVVEGPMRDAGKENFVGCHALPVRHGMTVGELANMFQKESFPDVKLTVVTCRNWRRDQWFDQTGLPWKNPSPNMRHLTAATLYPGIGLLETTNISVGRGTERPFEWIGAPWINGRQLATELNNLNIEGVRFIPVARTPNASVHKDKLCQGVDLVLLDRDRLHSVPLGLAIAKTLKKLYPKDWDPKRFNTLLMNEVAFRSVTGLQEAKIDSPVDLPVTDFLKRRRESLIYP